MIPIRAPATDEYHAGMIHCSLALIAMLVISQVPPQGAMRVIEVETVEQLQEVFAQPVQAMTVRIAAGEYHLTPTAYTDPTCGNCQDMDTQTTTSVGLHIRNSRVVIEGPREGEAVIHTHAGYGVLIENSPQVLIHRLVLTGGTRSEDGNATDGAIVVRNSTVRIENNTIRDNLGDPEVVRRTVSGVMGIVGREGSNLTIVNNRILRNSWDGIVLYRNAQAAIESNVIDGVDKTTGSNTGGGRGVGIGLTWNAKANVQNNLVTRYWKGIGVFVDAQATIEGNIIEDIITWGISVWSAGSGRPTAHVRNNVVYKTGACGISIAFESDAVDPGELRNNIITQTAQAEAYDSPDYYCAQCALAVSRSPRGFVIVDNVFFNNRRATDDLPSYDGPEETFLTAARSACRRATQFNSLRESQFVRSYVYSEVEKDE